MRREDGESDPAGVIRPEFFNRSFRRFDVRFVVPVPPYPLSPAHRSRAQQSYSKNSTVAPDRSPAARPFGRSPAQSAGTNT
jgi:hypothetical protein